MTALTTKEKVAALRELTKGAEDCFASYIFTERKQMERWRPVYSELRDETILHHLAGNMEIGTYPMIPDFDWPRVHWVCADFDGKQENTDWKSDVKRALEFLLDFDGCPCFVNLSRSGQGAHVRMLFKHSVPAWMARRWFLFWLEEADVLPSSEEDPTDFRMPSFDRLIPPQDLLMPGTTYEGKRRPGNLAGCPLNGRLARKNGGTLPLDPQRVLRSDFEPDGRHWDHVLKALEERSWGEAELKAAIEDCPDNLSTKPPSATRDNEGHLRRALPVVKGSEPDLQAMVEFCDFMKHMRSPNSQSYQLWMAMATQLHRFGEAGHEMWHKLSALDPRYDPRDCDLKWSQTEDMHPVRCETLSTLGFSCPRLTSPSCNGSKAPAYFVERNDFEVL